MLIAVEIKWSSINSCQSLAIFLFVIMWLASVCEKDSREWLQEGWLRGVGGIKTHMELILLMN